ncbi:Ig domain-containing protein [Vibrio parahaemolyticus]|uniref:Ig-like domain-containing protein n=1 Tax=Vibrio parahaemolyticus TaxID=670 RepID=UPI001120A3C1|nr:Ig-like domain-containing protein [Vibrio parahaemolyticus]EGQ7791883.1 Ig domain-containing protein [Vibrio parahaemolyticus]EGQ7809220.1 Ig domain-containing protein [Vibrio parahaemolyticus]EGQ8533154.1 hypothetical protein [Vibrio parahaemolyticus]MBE4074678.1 Ig domain-containing protein [Vibrio parahaemolyticus]MBY7716232.1 Ig domain-containing protein [Vibrio parahaemolyticus]
MAQLFRDDEACNYFFEIMKVTKRENYIDELVKMSKEAESSKVFGYALYDSGAFPQLSNLSRNFFAVNYTAILSAMTSAGVFNSYILLIRQILGESTLIFHEVPNPGHLSLKVVKTESDIKRLATSNEAHLATSEELGILVTVPISDYTIMQLLKTIQALCQPAGIYVDLRTIYPSSIDVTPSDFSSMVGKSIQYDSVVTYDDGTIDNRVLWSSSNPSVATIDSEGVALTIANGETTITAQAPGVDSVKGVTTLYVRDVVSVSIAPRTSEYSVGDTATWTATVTYSDGGVETTDEEPSLVTWLTSDAEIAIPTGGAAYFHKSGDVTITARSSENGLIEDSIDISVIEDYERFTIVVGEGYFGSDSLTSVGVFLYSPEHPDYKDTYGEFSSGSWPSGEPIELIGEKAQFIWRRRSSDVITYFSAHSKWPKWRDWDGVTITLTHESESISQSLTFGNYYIKISEEGIPVHEFLTARIGQVVDVELSEYTPTAEERMLAKARATELGNE